MSGPAPRRGETISNDQRGRDSMARTNLVRTKVVKCTTDVDVPPNTPYAWLFALNNAQFVRKVSVWVYLVA